MSTYEQVKSSVKYLVLDLTAEHGQMDYQTLAAETGMPTEYAADRLVRYAKAGLLARDREGKGGLSTFTLTDHGRTRLRYFERQSGV